MIVRLLEIPPRDESRDLPPVDKNSSPSHFCFSSLLQTSSWKKFGCSYKGVWHAETGSSPVAVMMILWGSWQIFAKYFASNVYVSWKGFWCQLCSHLKIFIHNELLLKLLNKFLLHYFNDLLNYLWNYFLQASPRTHIVRTLLMFIDSNKIQEEGESCVVAVCFHWLIYSFSDRQNIRRVA